MGTDTRMLDVPQQVLSYLDSQLTLTLATATRAGVPRATTLTYANSGATLYVWTRPETTTARQMDENPIVSFAIDEYSDDWRDTKGIQGMGEARVVLNPSELEEAVGLFEQKYSALAGKLGSGVSIYRIAPRELQFIDNADAGDSREGGVQYRKDVVYSVFQDLPQERFESMAASLQTMEVPAGEVIVRQGAPADKFFIIVEGEVEVVRDDDGTSRKLANLGAGQFFGEMAILRDLPRAATVRAVTPTTLFAMERDAFRGVVAQSMGTTADFDQVIQQRLGEIQAGGAA
jgi:uncharacterized protein YhbP (UPF0306 family)